MERQLTADGPADGVHRCCRASAGGRQRAPAELMLGSSAASARGSRACGAAGQDRTDPRHLRAALDDRIARCTTSATPASRSCAARARTRRASTSPTSGRAAVGDCFFLSPLMAIARINPRARERLVAADRRDGDPAANVYEVTLLRRRRGELVTYRVDDRFVTERGRRRRSTRSTATCPPTGPGAVGDAAREGVGRARGGSSRPGLRAGDRRPAAPSPARARPGTRSPTENDRPDHARHPQRDRRRQARHPAARPDPEHRPALQLGDRALGVTLGPEPRLQRQLGQPRSTRRSTS